MEKQDAISSGTSFIPVIDMCTKRLEEIERLDQALRKSRQASNKRLFQTIPKHLRRRAASHNPNRLPCNYRRQGKESPQHHQKRKKKRNIKLLYKERTGLNKMNNHDNKHTKWLETHLWHAKRMHMKDLWGWRIPVENSVKVKRHLYRISKGSENSTMLHDKSYEECIMIQSSLEFVKKVLSSIADPLDPVINTISFLGHGTFWFYKKYPTEFLSTVDFVFTRTESQCVLALWVPPFSINDIHEHLKSLCDSIPIIRSRMNKFELVGNGSMKLIQKIFSPVNHNDKSMLNMLSSIINPSRMIPRMFSMCFSSCKDFISNDNQESQNVNKNTILEYHNQIMNNDSENMQSILRLFSSSSTYINVLILVMSSNPFTIHIILPSGCGSLYFDKMIRSGLPVTPASLADMIITKTSSSFSIYNNILSTTLGLWKSHSLFQEPSWIISPFLIPEIKSGSKLIKGGIVLGRIIMNGRGRPKSGSLIYSKSHDSLSESQQIGIVLGHVGLGLKGYSKGSLRDGFSFEKGCGGNVGAIKIDNLNLELTIEILVGTSKRLATFNLDAQE